MNAASKRHLPDDPREWLNRARSNLIRAKSRIEGVYLEDLCFDAQQAAEKAVKALLIHLGIEYPYVHDLVELLTLAEQAGRGVPESVKQASRLTRYAIVTRYPGALEPVTRRSMRRRWQSPRRSCVGSTMPSKERVGRDEKLELCHGILDRSIGSP